MKRFLLAIAAIVFGSGCAQAANPSFSSFATNHFITNNFLIRARLNPAQFDTNAASISITITNITGVTGGSIWTNDASNYRPLENQSQLTATNIIGSERLQAAGAFIIQALLGYGLDAGLNDISAYTNSVIWITGFDSDPANSSLRLDSGNGQGHLLVVQNYEDNSGFTMRNGEALFGSPPGSFQILNGDWVTSHKGDSILLYNNGTSWAEIGRMSGTTNNVGSALWEVVSGVLRPLGHSLGTNQFTIAEASGWSGTGTNAFMDDGTFSGVAMINPTDGAIAKRANAYELEDLAAGTGALLNDGSNNFIWGAVGTINPTDGYMPYRSNATTFANSPLKVLYPYVVELYNTNNNTPVFAIHNADTNGNTGTFAVRLEDSDGQTDAVWLNGVKGGSWGFGIPATRDGLFSVNVLHDNAMAQRFSIDGDSGTTQFFDRTGMTDTLAIGDSGQLVFGPGTTNVLYRNAKDLQYTNGSTSGVYFRVIDGNAKEFITGVDSSGNGMVDSTSGFTYMKDHLVMQGDILTTADDTYNFGSSASNGSFHNTWIKGTHYVQGMNDGAGNYSRLAISHSGTNGAVVLDSQSAGTAGPPRNHRFDLGSTNQFAIGDGWVQLMRGMTKAEKATITATNGMVVYQTDNTPGFRGYVDGAWVIFSTAADP